MTRPLLTGSSIDSSSSIVQRAALHIAWYYDHHMFIYGYLKQYPPEHDPVNFQQCQTSDDEASWCFYLFQLSASTTCTRRIYVTHLSLAPLVISRIWWQFAGSCSRCLTFDATIILFWPTNSLASCF